MEIEQKSESNQVVCKETMKVCYKEHMKRIVACFIATKEVKKIFFQNPLTWYSELLYCYNKYV